MAEISASVISADGSASVRMCAIPSGFFAGTGPRAIDAKPPANWSDPYAKAALISRPFMEPMTVPLTKIPSGVMRFAHAYP